MLDIFEFYDIIISVIVIDLLEKGDKYALFKTKGSADGYTSQHDFAPYRK